jgi:hypothetical protein
MSMYECDRCGDAVGMFCTCAQPVRPAYTNPVTPNETSRLKAVLAKVFGWTGAAK